jgi:glucan phosphoethanolaminetransferase (alkaline phosphatase superfamily)
LSWHQLKSTTRSNPDRFDSPEEASGAVQIHFSFFPAFIAAVVWSLVECVDLQLSGAVGLADARRVALFWLTHLSIGFVASVVLFALFYESVSILRTGVRRFAPGAERSTSIATAIVLFVFSAAVWIPACLLGLYPRTGKTMPIILGLALCAGIAYLFRGHFLVRRPERPTTGMDIFRTVLAFAAVLLAHVFNRTILSKTYFLFHLAATLLALVAAMLGVRSVSSQLGRRRRARVRTPMAVAIACGALVAPPLLFSASNDVRQALFTRAFDARTLIYLARKLPGAKSTGAAADPIAPVRLAAKGSALEPVQPPLHKWVDRVLLITIDTVRADHLSFYGYHRATAPVMQAFASRAALFERAWAEGPATSFAIDALFGEKPNRRGLPSLLRAAHIPQVSISTRRLDHALDREALESWFDKVITVEDEDDREISQAAVREIDNGGFRGFMWVHLMAPHDPYVSHQPVAFGHSDIDRYDGEILESDRAVGTVLAALERNGLAGRTAVIIAADHGEEFGDHGGRTHGTDVFSEQVRIPLLLHVPGMDRPRRIQGNVAQADIPVTITSLFGVANPTSSGARSLLPLLTGGPFDLDRPVFIPPFSTFTIGAVVWQQWKLNYSLFNGSFGLYDLAADPGERINRFEDEPQVAQRLSGMLQRRVPN